MEIDILEVSGKELGSVRDVLGPRYTTWGNGRRDHTCIHIAGSCPGLMQRGGRCPTLRGGAVFKELRHG